MSPARAGAVSTDRRRPVVRAISPARMRASGSSALFRATIRLLVVRGILPAAGTRLLGQGTRTGASSLGALMVRPDRRMAAVSASAARRAGIIGGPRRGREARRLIWILRRCERTSRRGAEKKYIFSAPLRLCERFFRARVIPYRVGS